MNVARIAAWTLTIATSLFGCTAQARSLRAERSTYQVEVLVNGTPALTFFAGGGTYVLGRLGERYVVRVHNRSERRIEAVVSVDGRDVIDGQPADFKKRGYLVSPYSTVDIDGWRISPNEAAAFRFSRVADSYAARTGSSREVGVIGVAVFRERWTPPPRPLSRPMERWPKYQYEYEEDDRGADRELSGGPASAAPETRSEQAPRKSAGRGPMDRPGLGTEFGEAVSSPVTEVPFERVHPTSPDVLLGLHYNDRRGLLALGIPVDGRLSWSELDLRQSASPFPGEDCYAHPPPGWKR